MLAGGTAGRRDHVELVRRRIALAVNGMLGSRVTATGGGLPAAAAACGPIRQPGALR